jgi:hypothetical protein
MRTIGPFYTLFLLLLLISMPIAKAMDLSGDCCTELDERIAELEATAAHKGDRKMNLTITGQVERLILWWDDGHSSRTYYGFDNGNAGSRFSFLGEAKVTSRVKVGFQIIINFQVGGTQKLSQFDVDGKVAAQIGGNAGVKSFTGSNVDSGVADLPREVLWIEDAKLGRLNVGRYNTAGAINTFSIDLAGISEVAGAVMPQINGGFLLRGPAGQYYGIPWAALGDPNTIQGRFQLVRYDSPTIAGFILSASIMEDGSNWGTMLRYANEWNGFRLAAGIGYEHYSQLTASNGCANDISAPPVAPCAGPADLAHPRPDVSAWGAGLAGLHIPSGLFFQGHYLAADFNSDDALSANQLAAGVFWGDTRNGRIPAKQFLIQGGITKNWFSIGNTTLYAEYSRNEGWGAAGGVVAPLGTNYGVGILPGSTAVFGVTNTAMDVWGAGITQNLDAAATLLYLAWRHFSADISCDGTGPNCAAAAVPGNPTQKLRTDSFDAIISGARVKF